MRKTSLWRALALASVLLLPFAPRAAVVETIAGGPLPATLPALVSPLAQPTTVVWRDGVLFISDYAGGRVARLDGDGTVSTVARGVYGDQVAALSTLSFPSGIAFDTQGNLFISDESFHVVWRLDPNGGLTVVGGQLGVSGYAGDGGPATEALFGQISGVAVDAAGNLYVGDASAHRLRKVDTAGIVTTVAGDGIAGFSGDGGPASAASVNWPVRPAVDAAGNVYFTDYGNRRVRRIDAAGTITTVAGTGASWSYGDGGPAVAAGLRMPGTLSFDAAGNLYICDENQIRRVDAAGVIHTVAGAGGSFGFSGDGGPASAARFWWPSGVAFDDAGNMYVADYGNDRIRKVDAAGIVTTVAGTGSHVAAVDELPATETPIYPWGIALDAIGRLAITDLSAMRVWLSDGGGQLVAIAGASDGAFTFSGDEGAATQAHVANPMAVAWDGADLYVADTHNNRVRKVDAFGFIHTVAGTGEAASTGDEGPAAAAAVNAPVALAVDWDGSLYVAELGSHRVRRIDPMGIIHAVAGTGTPGFAGDGGPALSAALREPRGLALDPAGNLLVADFGNDRLRSVSPDGTIATIAGNGTAGFSGDGGPATAASLSGPFGLAADWAGNVFFTDYWNHRVRRIDAAGDVTTVAGNGQYGFADGLAAEAQLAYPMGLVVDGYGDLFVATPGNGRVRWISMGPIVSFWPSVDRGPRGLAVTFTNTTRSTSGTSYAWGFGDGAASAEVSPTHTYAAKGIYSVSLTATGRDPADVATQTLDDAVCVGYVFSSSPQTATTAPFTRNYARSGTLYARAWVTTEEADFTQLRSATLRVTGPGGSVVTAPMAHAGNGEFHGSALLSRLAAGAGTATITVVDRLNKTFTATEPITLR